MTVTLVHDRYGKSEVRLVTVRRGPERHDLKDVTFAIRLEGDFVAAYTAGDNAHVVATDTMKNTVYGLAAERPFDEVEELSLRLTQHLLGADPHVASARVEWSEHLWERIESGGGPDPHSFRRAGGERRTGSVFRTAERVNVAAGLEDLVVMKTAKSAFAGFPRDRFTTLKETSDRLLATALSARWTYAGADLSFGDLWREARRLLLETFAEHESLSVQQTLYAMGEAVLEGVPAIEEIHLAMPNKHHLPVDLTPFGLENRNEIFVATSEPYGLIEGTLRRG